MKLARRSLLLALALPLAAALGACAGARPAPVAPADESLDGGASPCVRACARRHQLGCIEPALEARCVPTCVRAAEAKLFDPACAAAATTVAAMRACDVRCGAP